MVARAGPGVSPRGQTNIKDRPTSPPSPTTCSPDPPAPPTPIPASAMPSPPHQMLGYRGCGGGFGLPCSVSFGHWVLVVWAPCLLSCGRFAPRIRVSRSGLCSRRDGNLAPPTPLFPSMPPCRVAALFPASTVLAFSCAGGASSKSIL